MEGVIVVSFRPLYDDGPRSRRTRLPDNSYTSSETAVGERNLTWLEDQMCPLDLKAHQRGQDNNRRIRSSDDRYWAEKEVKQQSVTENCKGTRKGKGQAK